LAVFAASRKAASILGARARGRQLDARDREAVALPVEVQPASGGVCLRAPSTPDSAVERQRACAAAITPPGSCPGHPPYARRTSRREVRRTSRRALAYLPRTRIMSAIDAAEKGTRRAVVPAREWHIAARIRARDRVRVIDGRDRLMQLGQVAPIGSASS
jgi:hypothetical protein